MSRVEEKIDHIAKRDRSFSAVASMVKVSEDKRAKTFYVDKNMNLRYNPEFMKKLTDQQLIFVLKHELLHIIFNHVDEERMKELFGEKKEHNHYVYNLSCDAFVNDSLQQIYKVFPGCDDFDMVTFEFLKKRYGLEKEVEDYRKMNSKEFYDILLPLIENESDDSEIPNIMIDVDSDQCSGEGQSSPKNDQGPSSPESQEQDDQENEEGDGGKGDQEQEEQEEGAEDGSGDSQGDGEDSEEEEEEDDSDSSGDKTQEVEEICNQEDDGKAHTRIESFLNENSDFTNSIELYQKVSDIFEARNERNKTWKRPNRKYQEVFPISKGRFHDKENRSFIISIDCSGSITESMMNRSISIASEVAEKYGECYYRFFSTFATECKEYDKETFEEDVKNIRTSYGNDDHSWFEEAFDSNGEKILNNIVITDMMISFSSFMNHQAHNEDEKYIYLNIGKPNRDFEGMCVVDSPM